MEDFWTVRDPGCIGIVATGVKARFLEGSQPMAVVDLPGGCRRIPGPGAMLVLESPSGRFLLACVWSETRPEGVRCVCTA
ncbi:hypothetical protein GX411_03255 [Candidatus Fermentibacteria bacterium]|nr:hypothetical protein [Candidatus Fermentibacteria bacterium]